MNDQLVVGTVVFLITGKLDYYQGIMKYLSIFGGLGLSLASLVLSQEAGPLAPAVQPVRRQFCGMFEDCEDECGLNRDCEADEVCRQGQCVAIRSTTRLPLPRNSTARVPTATTRPANVTAGRPTARPTAACRWAGHCAGDLCETYDDCDGNMICRSGRCAALNATMTTRQPTVPSRPTITGRPANTTHITITRRPTTTLEPPARPTSSCDWAGHCAGDLCDDEDDCDGLMICRQGRCAALNATLTTGRPTPPVRSTTISASANSTITRRPTPPGRSTTISASANSTITRRPTGPVRSTISPSVNSTITRQPTPPVRSTTISRSANSTITQRPTTPVRPTPTVRSTSSSHDNSTSRATTKPLPPTSRPTTLQPTARPTALCSWAGHCAGDECETYDDCDGDMICRAGRCGPLLETSTSPARQPTTTHPATTSSPTTTRSTPTIGRPITSRPAGVAPGCSANNAAGCVGHSCKTDTDCGSGLVLCKAGTCSL
ncbi:hypothetical protein GQ53DRAFT_822567 [Thozetella sp. PMI_491]|nr:hypothetical protein GQ53DRAFT_822567 [Thozetella sp. PMI_491]